MSDQRKLLPCPFCGNQNPSLHKNDPGADDRKHSRVYCRECGCDGPHDTWFTLKGVIKAWNKRKK